jgi:poly [ADP-ribose] polymerase 2/3/4
MNQSDIEGNHNKFYIIQLLVHESKDSDICLFTRWGRVGVQGQKAEEPFKNLADAIKAYHKKCNEKLRKNYREVEMNYEENEAKEEKPSEKEKVDEPAAKLPTSVQDLVRLIFDMKMMASQMKEIGYDAKKMPLGKLAKASIMKGYEILKDLMAEIKGKHQKETINSLSSAFYSEIPHDFGFKKMANFVLDSEVKVKGKL